jgi:hypothetical protein
VWVFGKYMHACRHRFDARVDSRLCCCCNNDVYIQVEKMTIVCIN